MNLTTEEAAARLQVTTARIRQLIGEGRLKAEKHGRDWSVTEAELRRFARLPRPAGRPSNDD